MKAKIKLIISEPPARRLHVQTAYYKQARHFEIAADILWNSRRDSKVRQMPGFMPDIPTVVCHSFAVELYLKTLLQIEDKQGEGHNLGNLYNLMTPAHRARVEHEYAANATGFTGTLKVPDILDRCGDAFINWRYLNEDNPANAGKTYDASLVLPHLKVVIWQDVPALKLVLAGG